LVYLGQKVNQLNETKQAQLRLEQIKFINDPTVDEALTEILWKWEWMDFDEYWSKYSPRNNPEANITRRIARNYYVALSEMIRMGDVDIELFYALNPSGVTRYWEKIGPIAYEFRERNNYPNYLEQVEYLAMRIQELREKQNLPKPKQVT
jgi:hypothetical protein